MLTCRQGGGQSTMGLTVTGPASVDYMENGTDSVATYTATDPESATTNWSPTW